MRHTRLEQLDWTMAADPLRGSLACTQRAEDSRLVVLVFDECEPWLACSFAVDCRTAPFGRRDESGMPRLLIVAAVRDDIDEVPLQTYLNLTHEIEISTRALVCGCAVYRPRRGNTTTPRRSSLALSRFHLVQKRKMSPMWYTYIREPRAQPQVT